MKIFCSILFFITISFAGFSQYGIDWRNAPLNPIPVKYTLNHYKLTGPVKKAVIDDLLGKKILFFNRFGKLDSSITDDYLGYEKRIFEYDKSEELFKITSQKRYEKPKTDTFIVNKKGQLIQFKHTLFSYNQAGLLITKTMSNTRIAYSYNKDNQLNKKVIIENNSIQSTIFYYYKQYANKMRVKENRVQGTEQEDNIWTYEYDVLGYHFYPTNIYDSHSNYLGPNSNKKEAIFEYFQEGIQEITSQ